MLLIIQISAFQMSISNGFCRFPAKFDQIAPTRPFGPLPLLFAPIHSTIHHHQFGDVLQFDNLIFIKFFNRIGSSFAMMMFLWGPYQVVVYEALAHSARGFVALAVYIVYIAFDLGKL
jgi:hypothetical protein